MPFLKLLKQMRINNINAEKRCSYCKEFKELDNFKNTGNIVLPDAISHYVPIVVKGKGVI